MVKCRGVVVIMLAFVWVILTESITLFNIVVGIVLGILVLFFTHKSVPGTSKYSKSIEHIRFHKLITYPFWLIGQVYKSGFFIIKLILTGSKCGIVTDKIKLENESLRSVLMDSITLTPGTICLGIKDDEVILLCIDEAKEPDFPNVVSGLRSMEKRLMKAEIKDKLD